jgi:hypothetical protein
MMNLGRVSEDSDATHVWLASSWFDSTAAVIIASRMLPAAMLAQCIISGQEVACR